MGNTHSLMWVHARIDRRCGALQTPFDKAVMNDKREVAAYLLGLKADLEGLNPRGETPLFQAAHIGHLNMGTATCIALSGN